MNHYEVLGVSRDATEAQIKHAYRQKTMEFHPDRNPDDQGAEERFKGVTLAYEILSDSEKKQIYDVSLLGINPDGTFDPSFFDPERFDREAFVSVFVRHFGQYLDENVPGARDVMRGVAKKHVENERRRRKRRRAQSKPKCTACKDRGRISIRQGNFEILVTCRHCVA